MHHDLIQVNSCNITRRSRDSIRLRLQPQGQKERTGTTGTISSSAADPSNFWGFSTTAAPSNFLEHEHHFCRYEYIDTETTRKKALEEDQAYAACRCTRSDDVRVLSLVLARHAYGTREFHAPFLPAQGQQGRPRCLREDPGLAMDGPLATFVY